MSRRILYLHGLASSPLSTKAQIYRRRLAALGEEMALPDLNEGDFHGLTTSRAVRLATAQAETLPPPIVVFGSSFGGRVAVHTASTLGDRVAGLVLMAPALSFAHIWENTQTPESLARWERDGRLPLEHPLYPGGAELGYGFYEDAVITDTLPTLRSTLPVLIFHGEGDDVVPLADSEAFAAAHPAARLVRLPSDHGLTDQGDRLWQETVGFLDEVWGATP